MVVSISLQLCFQGQINELESVIIGKASNTRYNILELLCNIYLSEIAVQ